MDPMKDHSQQAVGNGSLSPVQWILRLVFALALAVGLALSGSSGQWCL